MKKSKHILALLLVVLFAACSEDRLDIPQKGVISIDSFYKRRFRICVSLVK